MADNRLDWNYDPKDDGAIEIPVRISTATMEPPTTNPDADEQVVREYEERYLNMQDPEYVKVPPTQESYATGSTGSSVWKRMASFDVPPRHRPNTKRRVPVPSDENDKMWAAAAHASAIVTLVAALSSGPGVVVGLFIPLVIYLVFRTRSEYVAFHALQAFTFQTVATVGTVAMIIGFALLTLISGIASLLIVGIPFFIMFLFLTMMMVPISLFSILFVMPVYSLSAFFATLNGRNFRYPWVADWVDDQLTNGKGATPAGTLV